MIRKILYQFGLVTLRQHWELEKELHKCKDKLGVALNQVENYKGKRYVSRNLGLRIVKKGNGNDRR